MPLPYTMVMVAGPGANQTPFKVYPSGMQVPATDDELKVWEHVQELEKTIAGLRAELAEARTPNAEVESPVEPVPADAAAAEPGRGRRGTRAT